MNPAPVRKLAATLALVAVALALTGCIKFKQATTIMPDKSGKMQFTIAYNKTLFDQMGAQEDPTDDFNPQEMDEDTQGFVAFSEPTKETKEGWVYFTFAGYFEDVNKVVLKDEENGRKSTYKITEQDGKQVLTIENGMLKSMAGEMVQDQPQDPQQKAMLAQMMGGMEVSESYTLPGKVSDAPELFKTNGRTTTLSMDDKAILDGDKPKKIAAIESMTLIYSGNDVPADEVKAFKKEMEEAKAYWEELKKKSE